MGMNKKMLEDRCTGQSYVDEHCIFGLGQQQNEKTMLLTRLMLILLYPDCGGIYKASIIIIFGTPCCFDYWKMPFWMNFTYPNKFTYLNILKVYHD